MDDQTLPRRAERTLPAHLYRDAAIHAYERDAVFRRTWQLVGVEQDLARAGDYLADEIGGAPILAVRGEDGVLRGFHNLCRHRAGPLVEEGRGSCEGALVCRYHGWRYALDGRLRAATDFGPAQGFDPRDYGLIPVRAETWRGLVFVNLDPDAEPLSKIVGPLDDLWGRRGVRLPAFAEHRRHELGCDWKVYVENFLEGYHLPTVHPRLGEEVDARRYQITLGGDIAVQEAAPVPNERAANQGLWMWLWPNLGISIYRGGMMFERMSSAGFRRTRLDYFYFHEADGRADLDNILAVSARTTAEDIEICEQVQRRLDGGIYQGGVLSPRHEGAVALFQARIGELHRARDSSGTPH